MKRGLAGIFGGCVLALAFAASASANTYCVPTGGGADCFNPGSLELQQALTDAQSHAGPDTVKVAAGAYEPSDCTTAGYAYDSTSGGPLTLVGAGSPDTVLTCPDGIDNTVHFFPILQLSGAATTVSGLEILLPNGKADRGLRLLGGASADHVDVVSKTAANGSAIAVRITGGSFRSGLIGTPLSDNGEGVLANGGAILSDVSITSGGTGIDSTGSPDVTLTRAEIAAPRGVVSDGGAIQLSDVAIDPLAGAGATPAGGLIIDTTGSSTPISIIARNVSIGGHLANSYGVYEAANTVNETAAVTLTDSVIHGPTTALLRSAIPGATANLTTGYDAYPAGDYTGTGSGTTTVLTPPVTADPGFPAPGNFRVDAGSPLIDAGTPGALAAGEPTTDPDGNPRLLDGNHDCVARRDIGAYEFNDPTPTAKASASASRVAPGARVTFHGIGCSNDPLAAVTLSWAFDDGATGIGADVMHAFARVGTHHATLTVRDAGGHAGSAIATVTIVAPAPPPSRIPALSKLKLKPARFHVVKHRHKHFKLGTTISYTDSLAATTTFAVTQKARGVVKGKRCVAPPRRPSKRGKKPKKCMRTVTFGTFTHRDQPGANSVVWNGKLKRRALKPGAYTLTAVAKLAGRKGRPASARFTVLV